MRILGRIVAPNTPTAPSSPALGEMYFDTATSFLYWWSGSAWVSATQGPQGIQGPQGTQGIQGPQGPQGPTGASGASAFVSGTGAPTAGLGVDGAVYLDVSNGYMYGPKVSGAWPGSPIGRLMQITPDYQNLRNS